LVSQGSKASLSANDLATERDGDGSLRSVFRAALGGAGFELSALFTVGEFYD
jgi:hypothetical protein